MHTSDSEFIRSLGFVSEQEQQYLLDATVSVAGVGGDGGEIALQLARMGVGSIKVADPDNFDVENINRQACATQETIGQNKAEVIGAEVTKINPGIQVEILNDGVTPGNVERFVRDSDLIIDETEFTMHVLGVMIAREARKQGVPDLMAMNIGFGGTVTSFLPNGVTFESVLGLSETASLEEIETAHVPLSRWLPYVPSYIDLEMFARMAEGEESAPTLGEGVCTATSLAIPQARLHLWRGISNIRPEPVVAPSVLVADPMDSVMKIVPFTQQSHEEHMTVVYERNAQGRVPKVS